MDPDVEILINQLRDRIVELEERLGDAEVRQAGDPRRFVFMAKNTSGAAWSERTRVGGAFTTFTDGRHGDGTGAAEILTLEAGGIVVLEVWDGDSYRYVQINNAIPPPWARNIYLISKEDPDNPGAFIWEANDARFRST